MPHPIVSSISQMNLTALESLLNHGAFYQDVPKKRFVIGMEKLFDAFKAHGNTYLNAISGNCQTNECFNSESGGYAFVGNASGHHIDLILVFDKDRVKDIFECSKFCAKDSDLKGTLMKLSIWDNLFETPEYADLGKELKTSTQFAILDLHESSIKNNYLNSLLLKAWLRKYLKLNQHLTFISFSKDPEVLEFVNLYRLLRKLFFIQLEAKKNYNSISEIIEVGNKLTTWLLENESDILWLLKGEHSIFEAYPDPLYFKLHKQYPFLLPCSEFKDTFDLYSILNVAYFKILQHVKTISDEEFDRKVELEGNDSEAYRLSYYLEEQNDSEFF